eukprot:1160734-Pelagomonas_calceolata.AAC.3
MSARHDIWIGEGWTQVPLFNISLIILWRGLDLDATVPTCVARCCCHGVTCNVRGNSLASIPTCRHTAAGMESNAAYLARAQRQNIQTSTGVAASRGWCGKSTWIATTWTFGRDIQS